MKLLSLLLSIYHCNMGKFYKHYHKKYAYHYQMADFYLKLVETLKYKNKLKYNLKKNNIS